MDELSEKFQRGGGSFSCRFWTFKQGFKQGFFRKKCFFFRKWGGGQRPFGTFTKIHPFSWRHLSLRLHEEVIPIVHLSSLSDMARVAGGRRRSGAGGVGWSRRGDAMNKLLLHKIKSFLHTLLHKLKMVTEQRRGSTEGAFARARQNLLTCSQFLMGMGESRVMCRCLKPFCQRDTLCQAGNHDDWLCRDTDYFPSLNFPPHTSITKRIKWIGILNMWSLFFSCTWLLKVKCCNISWIFSNGGWPAVQLWGAFVKWNWLHLVLHLSVGSHRSHCIQAFFMLLVLHLSTTPSTKSTDIQGQPLYKNTLPALFPLYSFWPSPLLCHPGTFSLNITLASALTLWKSRNWPQFFLPPPIRATEMVLADGDVVSTVLGSVKIIAFLYLVQVGHLRLLRPLTGNIYTNI